MEDSQIIALYHQRSEQAITETEQKYGAFCRQIAINLLDIREDAQECVNDTWYAAWTRMPPQTPSVLKAFLGRITRNLSISRFRAKRAQKRYGGIELMLSELEDCVPDTKDVEQIADSHRLGELISDWLTGLDAADCALFVRRYWYGQPVKELAQRCGCRANAMTQRLLRLRKDLKETLEQEGIAL